MAVRAASVGGDAGDSTGDGASGRGGDRIGESRLVITSDTAGDQHWCPALVTVAVMVVVTEVVKNGGNGWDGANTESPYGEKLQYWTCIGPVLFLR